ncbi:MAG: hypothetical protein KBT00_02055 [Bacteroidales bacterium]|nr:hypothetical protein [Candidatus Cacconaster merdequi]
MIRKYRWIVLIITSVLTLILAVGGIGRSAFHIFMPLLSKGAGMLVNAITFALFCLVLVSGILKGRTTMVSALLKAAMIAIWVLVAALLGKLASAYLDPKYPVAVVVGALSVVAVLFGVVYFKRRKKSVDAASANSIRKSASAAGANKYSFSVLYGSSFVLMIASIFYFIITYNGGNNFFVMMPLAAMLVGVILWRVARWRGFLLIAFCYVLACAVVNIYGSVVAYGFRAVGAVSAFSLMYLSLLLPLADLYCRKVEID